MVEYGVNDTTSYGVVFGKGDTEIDITGGGKLDGDNTYIGSYVKHTTEGGIELLGNIGFTKSDLDAKFSTHDTVGGVNYNIISDGSSDADAITLSLKAKKPYSISKTLRVEPMLGARYTLINQDAVESSDRNFRIDEWMELIRQELNSGRPILYAGQTEDYSAHAFVIDGYDENGMVHVNWGWGGDYDGMYNIKLLDPVPDKSYSAGQYMVIGIAKPSEGNIPYYSELANSSGFSGFNIYGKYIDSDVSQYRFCTGASFFTGYHGVWK